MNKNSNVGIIIAVIIIGIALIAGSYCAYQILSTKKVYDESRSEYADIMEEVGLDEIETEDNTEEETADLSNLSEALKTQLKAKFNFEKLKAKCYYPEDARGYIYQKGTIAYPILQGPDNDRYIRSMFTDMSYSINGSIFIDYRYNMGLEGNYCVIYGHNMNDGSMFGTLANYDDEEYFKKHPTFTIFTEDEVYTYKVAANLIMPVDGIAYKSVFQDKTDFVNTMNEILAMRTYDTGIEEIKETDHVIILSTCVSWKDYSVRRNIMLVRQ